MLRAVGWLPAAAQQGLRQASACTAYFASAPDYSLVLRQAEELSKDAELHSPGQVGATYGVPQETFTRKVGAEDRLAPSLLKPLAMAAAMPAVT